MLQTLEEYTLSEEEFALFQKLIYSHAGISLAQSKRLLVQSRLRKRLLHYHLPSYRAYYDLLLAQPKSAEEWSSFINCMTTNKTDFFREEHHFTFAAEQITAEQIQRAKDGECAPRLTIWHAGCSTGEEPYTLAITLAEALQQHSGWQVRQLASDIDTQVLAHAQQGIYDIERVAPVPAPLLRKYFLRGTGDQNGQVRVCNSLREQITFRQINLLQDPWPIRSSVVFDIIFCRNVVIYFDKPTQRTLFARFARMLRPGGYLFLGHSESMLGLSEDFESLGNTIYRLY